MIDGKNFFDRSIKNYLKTYDNIQKITIGQGYDYTTGCFLDNNCFMKHYAVIVIDLRKQQELDANIKAIQQNTFTWNLGTANNRVIYFITEEAEETVLNIPQRTVKVF